MRAVAVVGTYPELTAAIAARRRELGLTQLALDDRTGLPDGYVSKIECGLRRFGDLSMELVLQALGLRLVVLAVDEADGPPGQSPDAIEGAGGEKFRC
mgnify:CR=1 FL=1